MTSRKRYILRIVWELGPCPNREIAREAGMTPKDCYRVLYELSRDGYVFSDGPERYDITRQGIRVVKGDRHQLRLFD